MSDYHAQILITLFVDGVDDRYQMIEVALKCTSGSVKGFTNGPPEKCYPPEAAEFELDYFEIGDEKYGRGFMIKVFGERITEDIFEDAYQQAIDNGDF